MGYPRDIWIHAANILLGTAVLAILVAALLSVISEVVSHLRRRLELRAELDRDWRDFARMFSHK
ncbi:MAG TPA: hypothetical protein VLH09_14360 [Bryobacteraceae bacterium]|nr:hypothetical protein [Bryobacteraceae bacterium]